MSSVAISVDDVLQQEFITEKDLAVAFGCSVQTLRRWHALRQGPPRIKHRGIAFYRSSTVRDWLVEHEHSVIRRSNGGASNDF